MTKCTFYRNVQSPRLHLQREIEMQDSEINWFRAVHRNHSPLFVDLFFTSQTTKNVEHATGLPLVFLNLAKDGRDMYIDPSEIKFQMSLLTSHLGKNHEYFSEFADICEESGQKLIEYSKSMLIEETRPIGGFIRFCEMAVTHCAFIMPLLLFQAVLEKQYSSWAGETESLSKHEQEKVKSTLNKLKISTRLTPDLYSSRSLLVFLSKLKDWTILSDLYKEHDTVDLIAILANKNPHHWSLLNGYADEHGWLTQHYFAGEAMSVWMLINRIKNISKNNIDPTQQLEEHDQRGANLKKDRDEAVDFLTAVFGDSVSTIARLTDRYLWLRGFRLQSMYMSYYGIRNCVEELSNEMALDKLDIPFLTVKEITDHHGGNTNYLKNIARTRKQSGFSAIMEQGVITWGEPGKINKDINSSTGKRLYLQGVGASTGQRKARARIITQEDQIEQIQFGEILVTTMTTPDFIPALEKASAIVTDEGGLLCHASIISRELGLPCVIATGNSTTAIHTGDLIVVNGTSGTVEIIE